MPTNKYVPFVDFKNLATKLKDLIFRCKKKDAIIKALESQLALIKKELNENKSN